MVADEVARQQAAARAWREAEMEARALKARRFEAAEHERRRIAANAQQQQPPAATEEEPAASAATVASRARIERLEKPEYLEQLLSVHVHVQRRGEAQGEPSRGFGQLAEGLEGDGGAHVEWSDHVAV